jgi:ABC-type multidrug transport system ATPase subunit
MDSIIVKNVSKKYGKSENSTFVLNGLNMKVKSGSM